MGEGVSLSRTLPPLSPMAKVMWRTFGYIQLQPPGQCDPDNFFFLPVCLILLLCFVTQVTGSPLPAEGL
jgi:hypothetical protein